MKPFQFTFRSNFVFLAAILASAAFASHSRCESLATFANRGVNSVAPCSPCEQSCSNCCCDNARVEVMVGTIFLDRSSPRRRPLLEDTGADVWFTDDFDLGNAAGPEISILLHRNKCWAFGVRHVSADGWDALRNRVAPAPQLVPEFDGVSGPFQESTVSYGSELYSTEFNVYRRRNDDCTIFAGFRMVELHERTIYRGFDPAPLDSRMDLKANNHLYGGQLGLNQTLLSSSNGLELDLTMAAGIYGSSQKSRRRMTGDFTVPLGEFNEEGHYTSFVGELGLRGFVPLTRRIDLYGGYNLIWIDNVSLSMNQIPFNTGNQPNWRDQVFYHGATVGLRLTF